jgi:molecular chaperone GrpE
MEAEKIASHEYGAREMVQKLLPVLDNIERALKNVPAELKEQAWVQGVENLGKNLDKTLAEIGLMPIDATPGAIFNHELHNAVQMDEGEGETEVVAQELQKGYKLNGQVLREATVRVTRK